MNGSVRALRSFRRLVIACALVGGLGGALTATPASASCEVNPECAPNAEGTGCCKADCTWRNTNASCRLEDDACHTGTCNANHECVNPTGGNAANGSTCFLEPPFNACLRGECHGGVCGGIGSASSTKYGARCPDTDGNQCTDHCIVDAQTGAFIECGTENIADGVTCYTSAGDTCKRGQCAAGECANLSNAVTCTGSVAACKRRICNPSTLQCDVEPDPVGECDDNPDDCKDKFCNTNGACETVNKDEGTKCTPNNANNDQNACTEEQCTASGSCSLHIPYSDGTRPVGCDAASSTACRYAQCLNVGGSTTCHQTVDPTLFNTTCDTDANSCTSQQCNTSGNCAFTSCGTQPCALCGGSGYCAGSMQSDCFCTSQ